jgi:hypothetical protein
LACGACAPQNRLTGSVSEEQDLTFNEVLLRRQGDFLIVQYDTRTNHATEIVCKLAIDLARLPQGNLVKGDEFLASVALSRAVLDGSRFPEILSGSLEIVDREFRHGRELTGEFSFVFHDKRTLNGVFSGPLVEVLFE